MDSKVVLKANKFATWPCKIWWTRALSW